VKRSTLDVADVRRVMTSFERALAAHRDVINRLNVYPVPDGDTGTNMHLTLEAVGAELAGVKDANDMRATCKAISHGSLMGARGNSGVILCQILRGLAMTFAGPEDAPRESVGPADLVSGLAEASAAARAGVMKPVEGTILTVASAAAEGAAAVLSDAASADLVSVAEGARSAAIEALWRTPEQLPVLASAGVVDAGGAGLVVLFDALLHVLDDRDLPAALPLPDAVAALVATGGGPAGSSEDDAVGAGSPAADGADGESDLSDLRYEVMYFLEASDQAVPHFKNVWAGIGDSIVVVGGEGVWNCHIHTNDIGAAVEAGIDAGRPRKIRVTDLLEEVEEELWVRRAVGSAGGQPEEDLGPPPVTSVVAVATGDGIGRIFHSLGVRHIVAGGQSMNPSTEQILSMIEATPGAEVIVLPNNKNIRAVAAKACELSSRLARVVDTAGIQEGFAALLEYDPEVGADANAAAMTAAAERVVAGEVTQAVRASETSVGEIAAGDWIGVSRHGIEVVAGNVSDATCRLLDRLLTESHEIVTIIEGAGAKAADTRRVTEWLAAHRPDLAVELHRGGQPLYPYLVAVE
jgi:hypothetical protein